MFEALFWNKAEQRAMERVRARLADHVDHRRHGMTGLRGVVVGDDVELLNAFHGEVLHQSTDNQIFVVATIHVGVDLAAITAVDADVAHAAFGRIKSLGLPDAGNQRFQAREIAIQNGERGNFTLRNRADNLRAGDFDLRRS